MTNTNTQRGMTLIELMIVVAILGILTAIAIPAYQGYIREAKFVAAAANMGTFATFIGDFGLDNEGDYEALHAQFFEHPIGKAADGELLNKMNNGWEPQGAEARAFKYEVINGTKSGAVIRVTHPDGGIFFKEITLGQP